MLDASTGHRRAAENDLLVQIFGWSGNSGHQQTVKAINFMRNTPILVDRIIGELSDPLKIISCTRSPVAFNLNAPTARVWIESAELERILILMAQIARHTLSEPDRFRIHTWASEMGQGPGKLWLKVEADAVAEFVSNRPDTVPNSSTEAADPEYIDFFKLRSRIEAIPAHLAELSRSKTRFGAIVVFDMANEVSGHGNEKASQ